MRLVLTTVLLLPLLGCAAVERSPVVPSRPNLVVVLSDDQRWDALGAAGNPAVVTPVMDRMARDGVYFRQATVSVSQCHPIRVSLLTGLPAWRHDHSVEVLSSTLRHFKYVEKRIITPTLEAALAPLVQLDELLYQEARDLYGLRNGRADEPGDVRSV